MWVLTDRGMYSAVESGEDSNMLVVRARVKRDLVRLREVLPGIVIVATPERDYPYRTFVTRREWAEALGRLTAALDYPNFKDAVDARLGRQRHDIYAGVWSRLLALEDLGRRARPSWWDEVSSVWSA